MSIRNARIRERAQNIKKSKRGGIPTFLGLNGMSGHGRRRLLDRLPNGEHIPSIKAIKKLVRNGTAEVKKGKKERKIILVDGHRFILDKKMKKLITYTPGKGGGNCGEG